MARTFYTNGILQQQQTRSANTSKIPVYDNETALDADLANIPDNTLVATSSGHDDVIDQMKEYIRKQNVLSDWEDITLSTDSNNPTEMRYDGFLSVAIDSSSAKSVYVNNKLVTNETSMNFGITYGLTIKKGDRVYIKGNLVFGVVRFYKLRDYKGR